MTPPATRARRCSSSPPKTARSTPGTPGVGATGTGPSTVTETPISNGANAVYKGLAIAQASDGHTYLYATNFRSGRVEVYDSNFQPAQLPGGLFTDPAIPAGYAPFNIQELAGQLYVTYAKQDAALHDDVAGQGHGFVDVFTNDGALIRRLVSHGQLNSPWRSEEHTSELQSRRDLVCRLLLEKKKKKKHQLQQTKKKIKK